MADVDVIVIGGGLAGLAATAVLAERGMRVVVIEARPRPGGRAGSFVDASTGELIDNCQHVSMGCCRQFDAWCRLVGIDHLFENQPELYFIGRDGFVNRFTAAHLPAPLHLMPSLARLSYLTGRDKRAVSRALLRLVRLSSAAARGRPFLDWIREQRQSDAAIDRFWSVVLVSALSESLDRIDLFHARKVFVDGFLGRRNGWTVRIPIVPLDRLYGLELRTWLKDRHVELQLNTRVAQVQAPNGQAGGVALRDGRILTARRVITAVAHHTFEQIIPPTLRTRLPVDAATTLGHAPISGVHLWFDRTVTQLPHAVFVERLSQWMFNRTRLMSAAAATSDTTEGAQHLQVVISASRDLSGFSQDEVVRCVLDDLADVWPQVRDATLRHSRVVTEHRAVFSAAPGIDSVRPPQRTSVANLYLAGDWTRTGWPSTMEGAVRSGYLAARCLLEDAGDALPVAIEPELQPGRLVRLLSRFSSLMR